MGYPSGVFSPAVRSNGQTIDASHVQDLQDEVTAVETALLGTISHGLSVAGGSTFTSLQAGASTFASVSVSGGSTLASLVVSGGSTLAKLEVTGGSTFATLSISGASTFAVRPVMPPPDAVRVFTESTGAIASSVNSTISFTGEDFKTNSSLHSTGTNPERLTPQTTGVYMFIAGVTFPSPSSATKLLQLRDSTGNIISQHGSASTACSLSVSGLKRFDVVGGWVTASIANPDASTLSVSSGTDRTWFSMHKL